MHQNKKIKEVLRNDNHHRCDSCGNKTSAKKYNLAYLCISCLRMDKTGMPRDDSGKLIDGTLDKLVLFKIGSYDKELRRTRKKNR